MSSIIYEYTTIIISRPYQGVTGEQVPYSDGTQIWPDWGLEVWHTWPVPDSIKCTMTLNFVNQNKQLLQSVKIQSFLPILLKNMLTRSISNVYNWCTNEIIQKLLVHNNMTALDWVILPIQGAKTKSSTESVIHHTVLKSWPVPGQVVTHSRPIWYMCVKVWTMRCGDYTLNEAHIFS